jgi:hypothetical protein
MADTMVKVPFSKAFTAIFHESKGYLQTASILGNFEGGDTLWEVLVKLTTCDHSSTKDPTLDMVAKGSGSQSPLFLKEVGIRAPYF